MNWYIRNAPDGGSGRSLEDDVPSIPILGIVPPVSPSEEFSLALSYIYGTPDQIRYELRSALGSLIETLATVNDSIDGTYPATCTAPLLAGIYYVVAIAVYGALELTSTLTILLVQ